MTTAEPVTIDELLVGLEYHWGRLPAVAATFHTLDDLEKIDFLMEWPLQEDDLEELAELMASRTPTPYQRRRYGELLRLVDTNRPIIDALWQGEPVPAPHVSPVPMSPRTAG